MNNSCSFNEIRAKLARNCRSVGRNVPVDFTVRPIRKPNKSCDYQMIYLDYAGEQRSMYTCILTDELFRQEYLYLQGNSRNLLQGLNLVHAPTTLEEQLMAERMRVSKDGVTFYDLDFSSDSLIFNYDGVTYHGYLKCNGEWNTPVCLNITNAMNMKRNPVNWRIFSYLKNNNVFTLNLLTKGSVQLTFNEDANVCSGSTHFIIQEEFDRYEGMWWRPFEENNNEYHLLIEEYDQRMVDQFSIPDYSNEFQTEVYRYPRPGKKNAESDLKILRIGLDPTTNVLKLLESLSLPSSLRALFPKYEYLTNAGWTPDGQFVWIQIMDRLQNVKLTYLLPLTSFRSSSSNSLKNSNYGILFNKEENFEYWVPVNNNTTFLKLYKPVIKANVSKDISFCSAIMGMITTGFNHLYLINRYWKVPSSENIKDEFIIIDAQTESVVPLTTGSWQVDSEKIWINEDESLVYFLANRDDTISNYLYSKNYQNSEASIRQITNHDTNIFFNPDNNWAVVMTSTLFQEHRLDFINVKDSDMSSITGKISLQYSPNTKTCFINNTTSDLSLLKYDITDNSGAVIPLYGLLFAPKSNEQRSWPTIHYVYGGPGVRIIKNSFNRNFFMMAEMFNKFGYALLMCDGRGSSGRGIAFEGHVKNKMGTVELQDQIYFLRKAAEETELIDINRVGIYGSSYGGYLTIMALLQHPEIYKCGFSCSPVVDFKLYDTAYTERYLGIPESNPEVYRKACTLTYIGGLPTDCCRLTVAHGGQDENVHFLHTAYLMEEASAAALDIKLLFYPTSRHRIRRREHLDSNLIYFMNSHLQVKVENPLIFSSAN